MIKAFIVSLQDTNKLWTYLKIFLFLTGIIIISAGPRIYPDSSGYLEMHPIRSVGYPLFLNAFRFIGEKFLWVVIIVQVGLNLWAVFAFVKSLHINLKFPQIYTLLILLPFLYIVYKVSTNITTEAISVPLFLFATNFLFNGLCSNDYRPIMISVLLNILLVNIRAQFLFLYPVYFLTLIYFFLRSNKIFVFLKYSMILILAYIGGELIDRTYHLVKHGSFITTPFTGVQLAAEAMYIAKEGDYNLFKEDQIRMITKRIQDSAYSMHVNLIYYKENHFSEQAIDQIIHYSLSYNEIAHRIIIKQLQDYYSELEGINKWKAIDNVTTKISFAIIKANIRDFLSIYAKDILKNGFRDNLLMISFLILMIISIIKLNNSIAAVYISFSGLILIMNYVIVALVEPLIFRYTMYTDLIFLVIVLSSIVSFIHTKSPYNRVNREQ